MKMITYNDYRHEGDSVSDWKNDNEDGEAILFWGLIV
jgi:hypothetical protein